MSSSVISSSTKDANPTDSRVEMEMEMESESFFTKDEDDNKTIDIETTITKDKDKDEATHENSASTSSSSVSIDLTSTEKDLESSKNKHFALIKEAHDICEDFLNSCDQTTTVAKVASNITFDAEDVAMKIIIASEKIKILTKAISIKSKNSTNENKDVSENINKLAYNIITKAHDDFINTMTEFKKVVNLAKEIHDNFIDSVFSEETIDGIAIIKHHSTNPPEIKIGDKRKIDSISEENDKENKKHNI